MSPLFFGAFFLLLPGACVRCPSPGRGSTRPCRSCSSRGLSDPRGLGMTRLPKKRCVRCDVQRGRQMLSVAAISSCPIIASLSISPKADFRTPPQPPIKFLILPISQGFPNQPHLTSIRVQFLGGDVFASLTTSPLGPAPRQSAETDGSVKRLQDGQSLVVA